MEKLQITKGEYTFSPQKGKPNHCFTAQIWNTEGKNLAILETRYNESEVNACAEIMTDALNVYSETETLPSELLRQNQEMREALEKITEMNYQTAHDKYGDRSKAKDWSCVRVAEDCLTSLDKGK